MLIRALICMGAVQLFRSVIHIIALVKHVHFRLCLRNVIVLWSIVKDLPDLAANSFNVNDDKPVEIRAIHDMRYNTQQSPNYNTN